MSQRVQTWLCLPSWTSITVKKKATSHPKVNTTPTLGLTTLQGWSTTTPTVHKQPHLPSHLVWCSRLLLCTLCFLFHLGFLEKNRDAISYDIKQMIDTSTNKLLRQLFQAELSSKGGNVIKNNKVVMTPVSSLRVRKILTLKHLFKVFQCMYHELIHNNCFAKAEMQKIKKSNSYGKFTD